MTRPILASTAMLLGLGVLALSSASANTTTNWVIYGQDHGSGLLTLGPADNGGYDIVSFTGTLNGHAVSLLGGDPGWLPGPPNSNTPPGVTAAPAYSPYGLTYDNIYYPGNSPDIPCFGPTTSLSNQNADAYGIMFSYDGGEGEIWGNGTAAPYIFGAPGLYTFELATGIAKPADYTTDPYTPQTPTVAFSHGEDGFQVGVPEPATWTIMLAGFALAGAALRAAARRSPIA
jgi:PEP-CTERM motif